MFSHHYHLLYRHYIIIISPLDHHNCPVKKPRNPHYPLVGCLVGWFHRRYLYNILDGGLNGYKAYPLVI
jgi:hypothetical protein